MATGEKCTYEALEQRVRELEEADRERKKKGRRLATKPVAVSFACRKPDGSGGQGGYGGQVSVRQPIVLCRLFGKTFDPYFTTKQKGSGLGLTVAYSIIEKHAGYFAVASELGKGSTFNIYLPASPGSAVQKATPQAAAAFGSGRILVMDDEQFIRTLAAEMLKKLGYETAQALQKLK